MVEDDPGIRDQLTWTFDNYEVLEAFDKASAIEQITRHQPAVVTLDLGLPPKPDSYEEGLATLSEILKIAPLTKVIMVTGHDEREIATEAIARGAYDYYIKPIESPTIKLIVERAFYLHGLESERKKWLENAATTAVPGLLTANQAMLSVCKMIEKLAPNNVATLLWGESGTGKEVLAKSLHTLGANSKGPFVAINCAAIPENLLESELFGYEKGAFTGAVKQTKGKIELAHRGTLFLDEIGDLPLSLQPKLLRFLQERTFERLGGRESIEVDVRVVCATHQDLKSLIAQEKFREDLYYRLAEITIDIPPLRARGDDVILLSKLFISKFNELFSKQVKRLSSQAAQQILKYPWPGNIRELENRVKRAVLMAEGAEIQAVDLDLDIDLDTKSNQGIEQTQTSMIGTAGINLKTIKQDAERKAVKQALALSEGNVSKAALILGVTRPTLYNLMEKLEIKEKEFAGH